MRRLDSITRIERFIVDSLLSSPMIPLGVNVVRLAADYDTEGIAAMAYSIAVRYVGSTVAETGSVPLQTERTMNFELTHAAQSYLTQSGHDYALQMCAGAEATLTNSVPPNTGFQVQTPFWLGSENFQGLTDSSHYVYVQNFSLVVDQIHPVPSVDPCVWAGNCSYLFPSSVVSELHPGEVLYGNDIYSPVFPPPPGEEYDASECGVVEKGPNLYYKADKRRIFLKDWPKYRISSTETFDTSDTFLLVNIYDENGEIFDTVYYSNCDGRKVIQIAGLQPAENANWLGGLWRSPEGNVGNPYESGGPETLPATFALKNTYGYSIVPRATIWVDPRDPESSKDTIRYGRMYRVQANYTLDFEGQSYYLIGGTVFGKAYVRTDDFVLVDFDPRAHCETDEDDTIQDGEENTGPLPSC